MSKLKVFLILSGYQLTWLMCILGEYFYSSFMPGIICGLFFLIISFLNSGNKKKFISIIFCISIIGYLFDSFLVYIKVYNFETSLQFGLLPIWMLVLWPSFATLFDEVFVFLPKYKLIAMTLSGILGPLAYYSGSPLGLVSINQLTLFFILMVTFWTSLMFFYIKFLEK
ncbi:DUF2878 domain-containing protein [Alphaproteobacteria bacterium]|nr:DUF2878 domain-containing protein [Alphaproteobacteria bacterium]